jgi:NADH-quinone oxidoreductase subunit F
VGAPVELSVVVSNGMYVAGEETAVIATVEGGFPFPRRKPPFPAHRGVHGRPTVVNNAETLANVGHILADGPQVWRDRGRNGGAGTKLYSLSGDVLRPGLYELPMGTSLRDLVFEHGGGMLADKAFKAVFTGGPSNTLLTADDLDATLEFSALRRRGARLGTGAMIVIGEGTSIVRKLAEYMSFYAAGSCGQCPSCTIGTYEAERILGRIDAGAGTDADVAALGSLTTLMADSGRCGLVDGAATVLASSLETFGDEYRHHVEDTTSDR